MKKVLIGKCRLCGNEYSCYFFNKKSKVRKTMEKEHVCGQCAAWMNRDIDPEAKEYIIDGIVYQVLPFQENVVAGDFLGSKGKTFYILDAETMTSIKSNDVWKIGEPPPAFKKPDNAIFISGSEHNALKDGVFECHGVSCLDRYTCAMYFKDKVEKDGPVNSIPKDWVDGGEQCQNYLNINKINKFIMKWRKEKL